MVDIFMRSAKEDFNLLCSGTYAEGGWRAKLLGDTWIDLIEYILLEQPKRTYLLTNKKLQKAWKKRVWAKVMDHGFDPITIFLISLVLRLAIELVIWWLKNRGWPHKRATRLKEFIENKRGQI